MGANLVIRRLQSARAKVKWWVVGFSMAAMILHLIIELTFIDFSYGMVNNKTPLVVDRVFRVSFLASLLLGLFTLPRWYSWVALVTAAIIVFSTGGR